MNHVLFVDWCVCSMSPDGKQWLHHLGSTLVDRLGFRDNLVMAGQRGLTHGSAVEKVSDLVTSAWLLVNS